MPVNRDQRLDHLRRCLAHARKEAQVARLRGKLRDPVAQSLLVILAHPADAHRGAVIELRCDRDRAGLGEPRVF